MNQLFTKHLLKWHYEENVRKMPWKGEKDPYKIWLSEIILQQTRVEQGLAYYNKFIHTYPSVQQLASASEKEVFKLWEGLGYYSRCKNLIATAKLISDRFNGIFPDTYDEIKALQGIGPYTAAAVASFAFNLPYAVVDGNVVRCLSRYFGIFTPADNSKGKKIFTHLADNLLDKEQPALYNQAIMDFGAVICKPKMPLCPVCIQRHGCYAYKHNVISQLPVKEKSLKKKARWFYYFVFKYNGLVFIRKRSTKDIWENLYEFVLKENDGPLLLYQAASLQALVTDMLGNEQFEIQQVSAEYRQQLTHQTITGQFITASIFSPSKYLNGYISTGEKELNKYPFPKFITAFLAEKAIV